MTVTPFQPAVPASDAEGGWLDASWVVLPAEALPGVPGTARAGERRFVLLHPARGMAILDLWSNAPEQVEDPAPAALDAELLLASFLRRFDPRLPVRRIHVAQAALPQLGLVVARGYAGAPALELPESWMAAVRSMLSEPAEPSSASIDRHAAAVPRRRMAGGFRLAACIALLAFGSVGLLAMAGRQTAEAPHATPVVAAAADPLPAAPIRRARHPADRVWTGDAGVDPAVEGNARADAAPAPPTVASAQQPGHAPVASGEVEDRVAIRAEALPDIAAVPALPQAAVASPVRRQAVATPPGTAPPGANPAARPQRTARRTMPARYTQGWVPNSRGSFIRQQSQQYATSNGG